MIQQTVEAFRTTPKKAYLLTILSISYSDAPDISQIGTHLDGSPWITLNKQYCVEYLREFLKQVHLDEDLEYWMEHQDRREWVKQAQASADAELLRQTRESEREKLKRMHTLETCLQAIDYRLRIANPHVDLTKPFEKLSTFVSGIYVHHSTSFKGDDASYRSIQPCMTRPLKQLRRLHENYNIPSSKISFHMSYARPAAHFGAHASLQDRSYDKDFAKSLPSVEPRIWVADYDASVADLEEEIRKLRGPLKEKLQETIVRYPVPHPGVDTIEALGLLIEEDIVGVRELHLRIIEDVTKFWKAHDGWYELDDMFRIAES